MRTFTAPEITLMTGAEYAAHFRVYIENSSGVLVDMTGVGAGSIDHVAGGAWSEAADEGMAQGHVQLLKIAGGQSIVPMDEASTLNRNAANTAYEPWIWPGRQIQIRTAITAKGAAPSTWYKVFHGRIDEVDWADRALLRVAFRDLGGILADADIKDEIAYASQSLESMIAAIITNTVGAVSVYTPAATGVVMPTTTVPTGKLLEVVRTMAREAAGFDLRYKYHLGTDSFRLTLYQPNQSLATADFSMGADEYTSIDEMLVNRDSIFNIIRVLYVNGYSEASSSPSIASYGPRFLPIAAGSYVATSGQAASIAADALADLKDPYADHKVTTLFYPRVEIRDVLNWLANTDVYSTDRKYAVHAYEHSFTNEGKSSTSIRARSTPPVLSGFMGWTGGSTAIPSDISIENILTSYHGENLAAQMPSYNPEAIKGSTEYWSLPMSWFSRILRELDKVSGSVELIATNATDVWRTGVAFYNSAGTLISNWYPNAFTGAAGVWSPVTFWDATIPATTSEIRIGVVGTAADMVSAPVGTVTMRRPMLNRGPLEAPYNETQTIRSQSVRDAIAASLQVATQVQEPAWREGEGGVPGNASTRFSSINVKDAAGTNTLLDTLLLALHQLTLGTTIVESAGRPVNKLLAKPLAADPDTLDAVPDGSSFGKALLTALTSGQIDISKAGVINKLAQHILRTGGGATVQAILAQLADSGHATSGMQDSTGRALARALAKALIADPDVMDSVADGTLYSKVANTALTTNQIDLSKSGVINKLAQHILRTGGGATLQAIIQQLADSGHASSAMQDSAGRALARALAKALIADPDNADSVSDGTVKRVTSLSEANGGGKADATIDADGILTQGTSISDGSQPRAIVKGRQAGRAQGGSVSGSTWSEGSGVTFAQAFQSTPVIELHGGSVSEPRQSKWTNGFDPSRPVRVERVALNPSPSGFTPRARLAQPVASMTPVDDNFGANTLDVAGETIAVTLSSAPAYADLYKIRYTVNCWGGNTLIPFPQLGQAHMDIAIDSNDGSGWVERARDPFDDYGSASSSPYTFERELTISGLGASDQIRVRFVGGFSDYGAAEVTALDVQYDNPSGAQSFASMTPDQSTDASDRVDWVALSTT